jgi:hypothetical protein
MSDDALDLPKLAVFAAKIPYGNTTLVLNRSGAESMIRLLQDALKTGTASTTFYQRPDFDATDTQHLTVAIGPSEEMSELASQYACRAQPSQISPETFIRKYCKDGNT